MGRTGWGWCVLAGMLLGLAGCTWGDFLAVGYQQQDGKGEVRFVAGVSVDGVARSAHAPDLFDHGRRGRREGGDGELLE